jgi:hypothetical protein
MYECIAYMYVIIMLCGIYNIYDNKIIICLDVNCFKHFFPQCHYQVVCFTLCVEFNCNNNINV